MGILDGLLGADSKKELEEFKQQISELKELLRKVEFERDEYQKKNVQLIDKTHAFFQRLRILVGTLEDEHVVSRAWELLDMVLSIKKGGIFDRTPQGWVPFFTVGFSDGEAPVIPLDEDSMATFVASQGVPLSIPHLRRQDDLAYLERRGVIPDIKIACPIKVRGEVSRLLLICNYGGNVFSGEDDLDTLEMVTTILGLVETNVSILMEHKQALERANKALGRLSNLFQRLVAPEVIEYLEKNPEGVNLGGVKQEIVVMFVDIRGFTSISENLKPEKIIEFLNSYFTKVTEIIFKYKGTIDKFIGDAVMVLFGTPMPIPEPVEAAVSAAQEIQDMLQDNMPEWVGRGFPAFSVGIGINFQEVIVGNVGSQKLSSFTAIGDGVNLASRLSTVAQGGEILVSESVYENLKNWEGKIEQRPKIHIKGKADTVTVYALSRYANYRAGACSKCGNHVAEGVRFCGKCGFRRF